MKNSLFSGKSSRTKIFTVISAAIIIVFLLLNLFLTDMFAKRLVFVDTTKEGFYTLSEAMQRECAKIFNAKDENGEKRQIKITFCTDPDYLMASRASRVPYTMALALENMFENLTVNTVNVSLNPTAVSAYTTTSRREIAPTDIIISYGAKYRVVSIDGMWTTDYFSYNGEYKLVSILSSLTAINHPKVYFTVNHGETYYDPSNPDSEMSKSMGYLADLLTERGFEIELIDLSKDSVKQVPDDCALLIINDPASDFVFDEEQGSSFAYVSECEKIDRYLLSESGALIVNRDYERVDLPILDSFMREWGIAFGNAQVSDEGSYLHTIDNELDYTSIFATYDTDENGIGGAYYGDYSAMGSAPQMMFTNTGYLYCSFPVGEAMQEPGTYNSQKIYSSFITTTDKGRADSDEGTVKVGKMDLAALVTRTSTDEITAENSFSYVFCTNTADFFSNDILGNTSYANYDVMCTVIDNISRTERHASMELGGISMNSPNFGGKQTISTEISDIDKDYYNPDGTQAGYTKGLSENVKNAFITVICLIPLVPLFIGAFMYIRRKYL